MSSALPAHDHDHRSARRLWWYVVLNRTAVLLAIGAFIAFMFALMCVPNGFVGPRAASNLFVVLGANGAYVHWPRLLCEIGGLLILCAAALKVAIQVAFR